MNIKIFKDHEDFLDNKEDWENWVSQERLNKNNLKIEDIKLNYCNDCFNCNDCDYCNDCIYCYECETCNDCNYCDDCKACKVCIKCNNCNDCKNLYYK